MPDFSYLDDELRRYVEYLQRQLATPGWDAIYDIEAYRTFFRGTPAIAKRHNPRLWSEFANRILQFAPRTAFDMPEAAEIFGRILDNTLAAAGQLSIRPARPVMLANSTDLSSGPVSLPSPDRHILFAGLGTMSFCNYWAKAFARIVGYFVHDHGPISMTPLALKQTFMNHPDSILLPIRLVAFHSYFKTLVGFGEVADEPGNSTYRMQIVSAMEHFAVAHELGHFFLEEQVPVNSEEKIGPGAELVCDRYALQVSRTVASSSGEWIAFTGAGAYLLFRASAFSLPCSSVSTIRNREASSHPELRSRAKDIREHIVVTTPSDQLSAVTCYLDDFEVVCDEIENVLSRMPAMQLPP